MANDVYLITNTVNGKKYVGVTKHGYQFRFHQHILESRANHHNSILHKAIVKYGEDKFIVEPLEVDVPDELLKEKEKYYIKLYYFISYSFFSF